MKNKILAIILAFLMLPKVVLADGMVVPPDYYYMRESKQKAAIFYDGKNEDLIISTSFEGNAESFAWVVPTPGKPEVKEASGEIFTELAEYTKPKDTMLEKFINFFYGRNSYRGDIYPMMNSRLGMETATDVAKKEVEVISEKQVGAFDTATLKAENSTALEDWLKSNGYQTKVSKEKVVEDYIKSGWYFVAMKVNSDFQTQKTDQDLRTGAISPIHLRFETEKLIYPLKISSINSEGEDKEKLIDFLAGRFYNDLYYTKYSVTGMAKARLTKFTEAKFAELRAKYLENNKDYDYDQTQELRDEIKNLLSTEEADDISVAAKSLNYRNYDGGTQPITVYLFADGKMNASNYNGSISYAEKITKNKINKLIGPTSSVERGYYLSKINIDGLYFSDMKADLLFKAEKDNKEVASGQMSFLEWISFPGIAVITLAYSPVILAAGKLPMLLPLVLLMLLGLFVYLLVKVFKEPDKKKLLKTLMLSYFLTPLGILVTFLSYAIFVNMTGYYNYGYNDDKLSMLALSLCLLSSVALGYFFSHLVYKLAYRKNKYKLLEERVKELEELLAKKK